MNVTFSLDDDLVKRVRKIAFERDTTLTGIIRDSLEQVATKEAASSRKRREREALEQSFQRFRCKVGRRTRTRADLYAASDFLDANVFVYAYDPRDRRKQRMAQGLRRRALNGDFLTSV